MKLFTPTELSTKAAEAFRRFPFVLVWVTVSTMVLIVFANEDVDVIFEEGSRVTLIAALGVPWLIGAQFYIEQFKRKGLWWIKMLIIALLILMYYILPIYDPDTPVRDVSPYTRWALYFITGHLTLLFAPFITVWHPKAYWNYVSNIFTAICRSALFSGVLFLGLVLAMLAVQYLFAVDIHGKRYFQLFLLCLGIINTWVYLSGFPKDIQHAIHLNFYKGIEVFVKFILIPLAALYIVILYAYFLKILVQWELPKGWVSYLITILSGLLFLIQGVIHPVRISHESLLIKKFQPLAYWLLLPLLILLYVAIYKRISDYGVTEARYFLILVALFITGATLYLLISRKQQLRYLPIALAILALGSSFGPWGAFSMSKKSQLAAFKKVYTAFAKAEKNTPLSTQEYNRFKSITSYLYNRDGLKSASSILGYDPLTTFTNINYWQITDKIIDSLGLKVENRYDLPLRYYTYEQDQALFIGGYQWSKNFYFTTSNASHEIAKGYRMQLSSDGQSVKILKGDTPILELPAEELIRQLQDESPDIPIQILTKMQLQGSTAAIDVHLHFNTLNVRDDAGILTINDAQGVALLNVKE